MVLETIQAAFGGLTYLPSIVVIIAAILAVWYGIRRCWARMGLAIAAILVAAILVAPTPVLARDSHDMTPPVEGEVVLCWYNWTHGGRQYQLSMELSAEDYYLARQTDRGTTTLSSYAGYIQPTDPAVQALARSLLTMGGDPALLALSFVRSLEYQMDMAYTGVEEYPKYPIETLMDSGGDCEDFAILYVSVMQALGRPAVLLAMLDTPIGGHMAAGISGPYTGAAVSYDGMIYYYAETTASMDVGQVPPAIVWEPESVHVLGAST